MVMSTCFASPDDMAPPGAACLLLIEHAPEQLRQRGDAPSC